MALDSCDRLMVTRSWRLISAISRGIVQLGRSATGASSNGVTTRSAASVLTGGGPAYTLAFSASTPPRRKSPRQKRTVSSRTRKTSAIRALVHPLSVNRIARARSASPRSRDAANASSCTFCSSLAATGDFPAMLHPRASVRKRNHSRDSLVKLLESA